VPRDAGRGLPTGGPQRSEPGPDPLRLPREHVRAVRESIDVGVFFTRTVPRAIVRHLICHPLDPLPIVRARRALNETAHHDHNADR
jgi:hypothetical protein